MCKVMSITANGVKDVITQNYTLLGQLCNYNQYTNNVMYVLIENKHITLNNLLIN